MKNKVQLITYPDSLGKDLKNLDFVLERYFKNLFGGLHILPFYPSSGDRGFAPLTHLKVDQRFGNWNDICILGKKYTLMVDLMVNHISSESIFFQDYLQKENFSKYADYFITAEKFSRRVLPNRKKTFALLGFLENLVNIWRYKDWIFHLTGVNKKYLKKIYRPRPGSPFVLFKFFNGKERYLWCTFTKNQIDLDVRNENVKKLFEKYIVKMAQNKVNIIRLDAVGYTIKKRGTTSFMLPKTYAFIKHLAEICHKNNVFSLPEIHHHYSYQLALSKIPNVDFVYDFQLPLLVLHALYEKSFKVLEKWLAIRPKKIISVLDTHDGIPIIDTEELLSKREIKKTSRIILQNEGNEAKRASGKNGAQNVDTYQINCTYFSALGKDENAYIIARAIQFFIPGIPQVYYVGLLAGQNDLKKFEKTNIGRDINRHDFTISEIERELERLVVKRLLKLIRFRNNCPVFEGKFNFQKSLDNKTLILNWKRKNLFLEVEINLSKKEVKANLLDKNTKKEEQIIF